MKMRICMYTDTALPKRGGQEAVVDSLARQFQSRGHDIVVLAPRPRLPMRPDDAKLPYPVVRHPRFYSTRYLVAWYRWFLLKLHRKCRFDVLHCHGVYPPGYLAAIARDRLNIPVVVTSHGGDVREGCVRLAKPVLRERHIQALEAADVLISISRFTRGCYEQLAPRARRIVDIPNGVEIEPYFEPADRPADLDASVTSGEYLLFLGRLKHRKGVDVLLRAIAGVPPTGRVQLVIGGDGEERAALESLATELKLRDRVHFAGWISGATKSWLLQNSLSLVIPTRVWESFGLVVLESYAAGRPVVGTDLPGVGDLIEHGRTGCVVQPESVEQLQGAIADLFADRQHANRLSRNARQVALNYTWASVAERHLDLYAELVGSPSMCRAA
jgi:glycosyltransferase involved in cell wall biosynthesis